MDKIKIAFIGTDSGLKKFNYDTLDVSFRLVLIKSAYDLRGHDFKGYIQHYSSKYIDRDTLKEILYYLPIQIR